jgi:hypothetical protein
LALISYVIQRFAYPLFFVTIRNKHYLEMAPTAPTKKKKVRVVNPNKVKDKAIKKQSATHGRSDARKKIEDARRKVEEMKAKKAELEGRVGQAKGKEKTALRSEIEQVERELAQEDKEMKDAQAEEEMYKQREEEADNEDEYSEKEMDDHGDPDNPIPTTEADDTALITALLAGTALDDHPVPLDVSTGAGLNEYEKVIGYKNGLGKSGIICNTEIKGWPVYRIRRNVVIGDEVPNIIEDRRAGTVKDKNAGTKWGWSDALAVRGIAVAVPSGYSGNAEDLVVPVQRFSAVEKEVMKKAGKPIPKQPDVQVLIEWKTPGTNGKVLSWESRSTSAALWKKVTPIVLWDAAKHFEGYFRAGGGKDVTPFGMPFGSSQSPKGSPDPDQFPSTKTTPEGTPEPQPAPQTTSNSTPGADKKAARAEFKSEWCEEMGIDPEKMTDADRGSFMASFKVYWDKLNEKS